MEDEQLLQSVLVPASEIEVAEFVEIPENVNVVSVQDQNGNLSKKNFVCTICSTAFTRKLSLQRHINGAHLKWKQYKCDYEACPFAIAWKSEINTHKVQYSKGQ